MLNSQQKQVDAALAFIFIQRLLQPIDSMDIYKKGFIDRDGKIKITSDDITMLDRVILLLKRLLRGKLSTLANFAFVKAFKRDFTQDLIPRGNILQRAEIKRIVRELDKINEKYSINNSELVRIIAEKEIKNANTFS